jgi:hypothetical protein
MSNLIGMLTPGDQYQHQRISLSNGDKYEVYSGHTEILGDMVRILAKNEQGEYLREIFLRKESVISVEKLD